MKLRLVAAAVVMTVVSACASFVSAQTAPLIPEPSADHLVPYQRAMLEALPPPAEVKSPPATRSPFGSVVSA